MPSASLTSLDRYFAPENAPKTSSRQTITLYNSTKKVRMNQTRTVAYTVRSIHGVENNICYLIIGKQLILM